MTGIWTHKLQSISKDEEAVFRSFETIASLLLSAWVKSDPNDEW